MNTSETIYINDTPVIIKDVDYDRKLTKMSHRQRKLQNPPVLECGNAGVVFQFAYSKQLLEDIELWWEIEYQLKKEDFNVELYSDLQNKIIELRFFDLLPYYKPRERHSESILDNIKDNVLKYYESLPQCFRVAVDGCYIHDWDYI